MARKGDPRFRLSPLDLALLVEQEPGEDWRSVEDFPHYAVSRSGRVFSCCPRMINGNIKQTWTERAIEEDKWRRRLLSMTRWDAAAERHIKRGVTVARLVLETFLPRRDSYMLVAHHVNEHPGDDRLENLRWQGQGQHADWHCGEDLPGDRKRRWTSGGSEL